VARIRSIKPEAFTSETLAGQSVHARWTFAGLWTYVDDDGRGRANAGLIKAAVWPLDDDVTPKHVDAILDELEDAYLICRYEVDGKGYLHVVNFDEHQHPNRPVPSKLPACTRRTHGGLTASSVSPHPKGPAGSAAAGSAPSEVKSPPEAAQTAKVAGQQALSEDAVRTHGVGTTKSSSTPPTPLRNELGEVDGDGVGVPPTAGGTSVPPTAQTILASFIDWDRENGGTLTKRTTGQLAKSIAALLEQKIDDRHIRRGLADWRASGQNPSTFDSFVNAAMKGVTSNGRGASAADQRRAEVARLRELDRQQREGHPPNVIPGSVVHAHDQ